MTFLVDKEGEPITEDDFVWLLDKNSGETTIGQATNLNGALFFYVIGWDAAVPASSFTIQEKVQRL